jgi:hypothetical protein
MHTGINYNLFYITFWRASVLAALLLMSPTLYFIDVWIRTQRAAVASRRATNLVLVYITITYSLTDKTGFLSVTVTSALTKPTNVYRYTEAHI